MNRSYRLVWNRRQSAFVPVAENVASRGKAGRAGAVLTSAALLLGGGGAAFAQTAPPPTALPQGGQVAAGQSTISTSGARMDIVQATQKAIINWQQFNVGAGASVNFQQPNAQAVSLNRVVGGDASQIAGRINANGQVFLVNPNGVLFAKGSQANVGGLVASTLNISDADFMAGRLKFSRNGATGKVLNEGEINVSGGGLAALLGSDVANAGIVRATRGSVVLAAGEAVTISFNGGSVNVLVDPANVAALVRNEQLIEAAGGQIVMSGRAANALLGAAIHNSGTVSATSLVADGGSVRLVADAGAAGGSRVANSGSVRADGGMASGTASGKGGSISVAAAQFDSFGGMSANSSGGSGGSVGVVATRMVQTAASSIAADGAAGGGRVVLALGQQGTGGAYLSGTLSASSSGGSGGGIDVTGRKLDLFGTRIAAHGATGGGSVRIGGDYQGANAAFPNAQDVTVNNANIDVSATQQGPGGRAIVWSDGTTLFGGRVDARGASAGIKSAALGGLVEVSGKEHLGFNGEVQAQTLLLDPLRLNIVNPGTGVEITNFVDPDAAPSGFGLKVYDVGNNNLLVLSPNQAAIGSGAGYVFQRDGTLISALRDTGAVASWRPLGSDRYLIANPGAAGGVGALSYFNALSPPSSGRMDSSNSLVGSNTYGLGFGSNVHDLGGGYWAATMATNLEGLNAYTLQRGAWHLFRANNSGSNLATGTVGPANSLVGSNAGTAPAAPAGRWQAITRGDAIGVFADIDLRNTNFTSDPDPYVSPTLTSIGAGSWVLGSPLWNNQTGAVTVISPTLIDNGTLRGAISSSNSIVGTAASQAVGLNLRRDGRGGVGLLQFGGSTSTDYVLNLNTYGGIGALVPLTPAAAATGILGGLSASNALLFSAGDSPTNLVRLSNGAVALLAPGWNGNRGYARILPFNTDFLTTVRGQLSAVSASNSLIGVAGNLVGNSLTDLGNGAALIGSGFNGLGAYTWLNSASPVVGTVGQANSLVGSSAQVLRGVTVLSNGAYLVQSRSNNNATGGFAYGAAGTGISGLMATVGATDNNFTGLGNPNSPTTITDLGGGAWVMAVPGGFGFNGRIAGLVWGSSTVIRSGQLTAAHVLQATTMSNVVFQPLPWASIAPLGTGTFAVSLPYWGPNQSQGAIARIDANNATVPTLSSSTALVGNANDFIGGGLTALGNGRSVFLSPNWSSNRGAVTLVDASNAASRLVGNLSASNSLVGTAANDYVGLAHRDVAGFGPAALLREPVARLGTTDTVALTSPHWNGERGAVLFFNRTTGDLLGTHSAANSLVGQFAGDRVGQGGYYQDNPFFGAPALQELTDPAASRSTFFDLGSGRFALRTANWRANANDTLAAGALTWIDTNATLPVGTVGASNSLVGAQAGDRVGNDAELRIGTFDPNTNVTTYADAALLFQPLAGGYYGVRSSRFNGGLGAFTVLNGATPTVGTMGVANSIVNTGTTVGLFQQGATQAVALGSDYALLTPNWNNNSGAITFIAANSTPVGAISSTLSLVGSAGQGLGGSVTEMGSGRLGIASPLWNGTRGAATLFDASAGYAAALRGTLTLDATNSFLGVSVGDRVGSGGMQSLANDVYLVYSPNFGSSVTPRTEFGAVTLGDKVTNAVVGYLNDTNSFFSASPGQAAATFAVAEGSNGVMLSTGSEVGRVEVTQPVPLLNGQMNYSTYAGRRVFMRPATATAVLNTGTDLVLQATDAINVLSPIVSNNPSGNGGKLTLQTQTGNITIGPAGRIDTDGGALEIRAANAFINNATTDPFTTGAGGWMVYANNASSSQLGTLDYAYKQYGTSFGGTLLGTGNGVVFVEQPTITVSPGFTSRQYDGTRALGSGSGFALTGLVGGDTLPYTAQFASIHAGTTDVELDVTGGVLANTPYGTRPVYGYLGTPAVGFTTLAGAGFIAPFTYLVDLAQTLVTKVYDGTADAANGFVPTFTKPNSQAAPPNTLTVTVDTANFGSMSFIDINTFNPAGNVATATGFYVSGPLIATNISGGGLASDYDIQIRFDTTAGSITPRPLTGGVTVNNKVYDGITTATLNGSVTASLSGLVSSIYNTAGGGLDVVTVGGTGVAGAANFSDKNAGIGKTVTVGVTGLTLGGADAANYTVGSAVATANITPKALSVTGSTVVNRQFNGTTAATINVGTLSGFINTETVTASGSGIFASPNVGNGINVATTYALANGTNGGLGSNYSLAGQTLTGNITQAYLALIVGNLTGSSNKVYDGSNIATLSASNYLLTGWVNGDGTDVTVTKTTGTYSDANVGTGKTVTVSLASGDFTAAGSTLLSNYGLPVTAFGSIGAITAKSLTAIYSGSNRVYDRSTTATVTGASSDIVGGDTVTFSQTASFADKNVANGKTITITGIGIGGAQAGNYSLQNTTATTTANITAKALTASYTGTNKTYDRSTAAAVTGASGDVISGDAVTFNQSAAFTDKNAANGKTINVSSIVLGGGDAGNYSLQNTAASTTANIIAKALTASFTGTNRVYDQTTAVTVAGASNDIITGDAVTFSETAAFSTKNAGTGKTINVSGISLGGGDAGNYSLQNTTATTTANVTAKALTASYTGSNRAYDTTTAATVAGGSADIIGGDAVTFTQAASFATKAAGTGKTIGVSSIALGGSDAGNYSLQNTTASTAANIAAASLSVTGASAVNKTYDGTAAATVTGAGVTVLGADSVTLSAANANFANKNVGNAKVVTTAFTLSGADAANYTVVQAAGLAADIAAKSVSASYTGVDKVYDRSTTAAVTGSLTGGINGDTITYSQTAAFADRNVGTAKSVGITGISLGGADAGNYTLASTTASTTANITPFALSIGGVTSNNKVYDRTTTATLSGTPGVLGVIGADMVSVSGTAAGAFANKNVGTGKAIVVSGLSLSGADAGNYSVGVLSATADITAKSLTASYSGTNKVYDAGTSATVTGASTDIISGDVVTFSQSAAFANKNAGTGQTINVGSIAMAGTDGGNYSLQNTTATTSANISAANLNVTGTSAASKTYDATAAASVTGGTVAALGSDSVTLSASGATFANKNVGTAKAVTTAYTLSGIDSGNYTLVQATGLAANISVANLNVTGASAADRTYDGTATASVTGGAVAALGSDSLTLSSSNANFADKNVGTGKAVTIAFSLSGTDASNYTLVQPTLTANVTPKSVTVSGLAASNKTYDGTDAVNITNFGSVSTGVGTETLALVGGLAAFSDVNAANGKTVTAAGFVLGNGANGGLASNYGLTSTTATTTANIAKAPLTMTAQSNGKAFTDTDPTLNAIYSGLVNAETSSVLTAASVTRAIGEAAGNYVMTPAAAAANYTVMPVTGTFTIAPADQLVIQVGNTNMVYGSSVTGFGVTSAKYYSSAGSALRSLSVSTASGVYTVDDALGTSASFTLGALSPVNSTSGTWTVGNYAVTGSNFQILNGSNFTSSTFANGNVSVSQRPLSIVTGSTVRREYDGTTFAQLQPVYAFNNLVGNDAITFDMSSAVGNFADARAGNGKNATFTGALLTGADATNYAFNGTLLAQGKIDPRTLTWTGIMVANKTYDATIAAMLTGIGTLGNVVASDIGQVVLNTNSVAATFAVKDAGLGRTVNVSGALTGSAATDYVLNSSSAFADVAKAQLLITGASAANKIYDATNTATVTGGAVAVLGSDSVTLSAASAAFADKNAGTAKAVTTAYTLSGTDAASYTLVQSTGLAADITAKSLTANFTGPNKVYDAGTSATVTGASTDIISGDVVTFSQAAAFVNRNAGTGQTINVNSIALGGADGGNYTLASSTASTTADITPKSLTVSGTTAADKMADGTTNATLTAAGTLLGVLGSDNVNLSATIAAANFVSAAPGVGISVNVTGLAIAGTDAGNYDISGTATTAANILAAPAPIPAPSPAPAPFPSPAPAPLPNPTPAPIPGTASGTAQQIANTLLSQIGSHTSSIGLTAANVSSIIGATRANGTGGAPTAAAGTALSSASMSLMQAISAGSASYNQQTGGAILLASNAAFGTPGNSGIGGTGTAANQAASNAQPVSTSPAAPPPTPFAATAATLAGGAAAGAAAPSSIAAGTAGATAAASTASAGTGTAPVGTLAGANWIRAGAAGGSGGTSGAGAGNGSGTQFYSLAPNGPVRVLNAGATDASGFGSTTAVLATSTAIDTPLGQGFTAIRELGSIQVASGVGSVIQMPADTFQHATQQSGDFMLVATLADGAPLPGWATFDSAAGTFTLRPPQGMVASLKVTVTARDRQGNFANTDMSLEVGN